MPQHLHLDFETFSEVDLRDVGAYRYAFDPSTEILCAAMSLGDEEPEVWGGKGTAPRNWKIYMNALQDPTVEVWAHNSMFEMAICQALLQKTWGIPCPDLSRFRCTMSLARRACLPAKLETLSEALQLESPKSKRGDALKKKFSMMQKGRKPSKKNPNGLPPHRIRPEDDPVAFAEFCAYCAQDVRAEQEVARRLAYFDEPINNANYSLDALINARGVPVNLVALRHAQKLIDEETQIVSAKFRELVGFEVTQNAKVLEWCGQRAEAFDNLQAETVDGFLEHYDSKECSMCRGQGMIGGHRGQTAESYEEYAEVCPRCEVAQALRLRQSIAYAAIKKVRTMLECAGPHDNRIRGLLNHHGATTGRWTSSLVQFQNMKRPTVKHTEDAYRDICAGMSREMLEICYGPPLEVISSCIRHFVEDAEI